MFQALLGAYALQSEKLVETSARSMASMFGVRFFVEVW
jgi:hypothetical protein